MEGGVFFPSYPNLPQLHLLELPIVNSVQIWRLGIARIATLAQCAFKIFALGGVSYIPPREAGTESKEQQQQGGVLSRIVDKYRERREAEAEAEAHRHRQERALSL